MTQYTKEQLDAINSFLDTKTQEEMLSILADPTEEIQVRFSTVFRPHMNQKLACKVCEKIAVNQKDNDNARMIALTMVRPVPLANEMATAIALDRSEPCHFRAEILFDYPLFATEEVEKLINKILNDDNEDLVLKDIIAKQLLRFAGNQLSNEIAKATA